MEAVWKKLISPETLTSLILVAAAVLVWFLLRKLLDRLRGRPDTWELGGKKDTVLRIVSMVSKTLLVLFTVVTVLQINGINISALVASLGLVSAVVGLALQDLLKDYIMGFNIMSEKFFSVGDPVRYNGREGIVIGFTARTTKIRDLDDLSVTTVSNRNISQITVLSNMMDLDLPLAYEEDPARIHAVLADLCEDVRHSPGVESCEYKGTQRFADSAVIYRIRIFCKPARRWDVWRAAMKIVQEGLRAAGLSIPYAQLDVHTGPQNMV